MRKTLSGRRPSQVDEEIEGFISLLLQRGVRRYLEIGAREGDTWHYVSTRIRAERTVAIDLPNAKWGNNRSERELHAARRLIGDRAYVLIGGSQDDAIVKVATDLGPYDAIFVDGDHSFAGVTRDYATYGQLAPLIAFHDIAGEKCSDREGNRVEVPQFWNDLKRTAPGEKVEFIAPGSNMGIGVLITENQHADAQRSD